MKNNSDELREIKRILSEHETRISNLENLIRSKPKKIEKKLSINEFIRQKKPKSDVEKTLAIGYYLEKFEGVFPFNVKDLEKMWKETKEKVPHISDKIQKNVAKGHMMETGEEKDGLIAYVLTSSGEKFVESDFKEQQ